MDDGGLSLAYRDRPRPAATWRARARLAPTEHDLKSLHAKIGELTLENDFLEGALSKAGLLSAKR